MSGEAARALSHDLAARGFPCRVEARDRLALLVPTSEWPDIDDAAARREVHALAAAHGFTHVALELDATGAPAGLAPGDASPAGTDAG